MTINGNNSEEDSINNCVDLPCGGQLFVDPADPRGRALVSSGGNLSPYSVKLWNLVLNLRSWPTVIDVGANYDEMIVWANFSDSAKIFAFEPNPQVLPWLMKTLSTLAYQVDLIEVAVSDSPQASVDFLLDQKWSGNSKLSDLELGIPDENRFQKIKVPCTSIDTVFQDKLASGFVMKIDVEGGEMAVLRGASRSLKQANEWAVMFEILHMRVSDISKLARRFKLYLYKTDENVLVRVPSLNYPKLRRMLRNPQIYRQDAVIISSVKYSAPADRTINFKISIMLIIYCSLIQGRF